MKYLRYFTVLIFLFSVPIMSQPTNSQCFVCHASETLQKTVEVSGGTEIVPLYVNESLYTSSTHGSLQCVQCHTDITEINLYTHASGGANALAKTYGSWARFSKGDTTLNSDESPRTRNYYTAASLSCSQSGCHESKSEFTNSRHHTISRLKGAHVKTVNGELLGEAYDKTCSRCHTTCGTCHFKTTKIQKVAGDVLDIWNGIQTQGESAFPDAGAMTEWAMDWTTNVASHEFVTSAQLQSDNEVCRSCHVGYYRPATYGYLSEEDPYPTAYGTSIKRHPQYYELLQSSAHSTQSCATCHTDVHSYPDGDFDWQAQGDAKCENCHTVTNHYPQHTTVDCISCHFTGFAKSVGQDGHDVWRWPVNNRVRPLAIKYKEALSWYPHNIESPDAVTSCAEKCHYDDNLVGASTIVPVELASFTSAVSENKVTLIWQTSTELNNNGFEIERASSSSTPSQSEWIKIGFVKGYATTTEIQNYSFIDEGLAVGFYNYRIKQLDFNGSYKYYNLSEAVEVGSPKLFDLSQNYPNPFNPTTTIGYSVPKTSKVSIAVYDIMGSLVTKLEQKEVNPGSYTITWDSKDQFGKEVSSGIYFVRFDAGSFTTSKKMILMR